MAYALLAAAMCGLLGVSIRTWVPTLTIDQVFAVADAIQVRYRLLVLLGALTSLEVR